jgi:hypothetical protein
MFVAVGSHTILTSPGGQRWRERPCPIAASLEHIECHAGLLIASDSAGIPVLVSTNGRKWLAY